MKNSFLVILFTLAIFGCDSSEIGPVNSLSSFTPAWIQELYSTQRATEPLDFGSDDSGNMYISLYSPETRLYYLQDQHFRHESYDPIIVKVNNNGGFEWQNQFLESSLNDVILNGSFTNKQGVTYAFGYVQNQATSSLGQFTAVGKRDAYIAKIDTDGNLSWIKQISGDNADARSEVQQVTQLNNGDLLVALKMRGQYKLGDQSFNNSEDHVHFVKITENGTVQSIGWFTDGGVTTMTSDGQGTFFVGGILIGQNSKYSNDTFWGGRKTGMFVASISTTGTLNWMQAHRAGIPNDLVYSPDAIYLAAQVDDQTIGGNFLVRQGGAVAAFDVASGNPTWAYDEPYEKYNSLALDQNGNILVGGQAMYQLTEGNFPPTRVVKLADEARPSGDNRQNFGTVFHFNNKGEILRYNYAGFEVSGIGMDASGNILIKSMHWGETLVGEETLEKVDLKRILMTKINR